MTTTADDLRDVHPGRQVGLLALAIGVTIPGIFLRFSHLAIPHPVAAALFGLSIVGAAFLLSWAAEVAQLDISAGLALAVLALIAVLPEYAVDLVFAWKGGQAVAAHGTACRPPGSEAESACSLALANMTGANRLLIGLGWSLVVFVAWYRSRKQGISFRAIQLERSHSVELACLSIATLYSLTLPLRGSITLFDAAVLIAIFVLYAVRLAGAPPEEPHLVGPARYLGGFPTAQRRTAIAAMLVFAAFVILACAEHFAEALVASGREHGVSEFLLVQWLAPLASEAPELLVATLFAWRLNTDAALAALVSSKVNQWTLLVGTLPIVFSLAAGSTVGLPVDAHQREELLLTAAQSFFAVATLASLSLSTREAQFLFGLFIGQFVLGAIVPPSLHGIELVTVSVVYLVLGVAILARERSVFVKLLRDGLRASHDELRS